MSRRAVEKIEELSLREGKEWILILKGVFSDADLRG